MPRTFLKNSTKINPKLKKRFFTIFGVNHSTNQKITLSSPLSCDPSCKLDLKFTLEARKILHLHQIRFILELITPTKQMEW